MPISKKHKIKFIHIPKSGGTSIGSIFGFYDREDEYSLYYPHFKYTINGVRYAPQHLKHSLVNEMRPESRDWTSFSVVRNPYTRTISEYFYINRNFHNNIIKRFNESEFNEWIDTELVKFDIDHKLSQCELLDVPVDYILKFEDLERDWNHFSQKIDLNSKLPHKNDSSIDKNKILKVLSNNTKDKIYNIFKEDFKKFGYKK